MAQTDQTAAGAERPVASRRRERVKRLVYLLILSFAAIMLVDAIVGDQGVVALGRARQRYDRMTEEVRRLHAENELMREQNRRLREDRSAQEETARRELGLMRPGEKVFIIRDLPAPSSAPE